MKAGSCAPGNVTTNGGTHDSQPLGQTMTKHSFQHIAPPLRLFSGQDSLAQLGRELDRANCRRAVIVCGASLARHATLLDQVRNALGERCSGVFDAARAHSPVSSVEEAAHVLERLGADAVVPVGGGSAIVTARAASILMAEQGSVAELSTKIDEGGRVHSPRLSAPKLPQFVVPTTPTTAIVKAGSAVFDPASGRRFALFDPKTRAQAVFVHPDFVSSAPSALVTTASINTLTLAIEGLTSRTGEPLADALLMHALRLVKAHLHAASGDDDARVELVLAAILCGQGTDHSGMGVATVLSHAIGARHDLENGTLNAILLPHALRFNAETAPLGLEKVASALDRPGASSGETIDTVEALLRGVGVPTSLREAGIPRDDLPAIAALGMQDWFLRGNPRRVSEAGELLQLLQAAWA